MTMRVPAGQLALATAATVLAGAAFADVFGGLDVVLDVVVVAAGVPALVATAARYVSRRRPHLAPVTLAQVAAFLVAGRLVLGAAVPAGLLEVRRALDQILEVMPAPDGVGVLLIPFALTFVASMVTVELICRTRRVLLVTAPSVALGATGLLLADGPAGAGGFTGSWALGPVLALALSLVALVALRGSAFAVDRRPWDAREGTGAGIDGEGEREQDWGLRRQRLVVGIPFVVVVAAIALPLGRALPVGGDEEPYRLREHHEHAPDEQARELNPLTRLVGDRTDDVRYTVRFDGDPGDARIRLVALDRYDGVQWTSGADHVGAGSRLPAAAEGTTAPVHQVGYQVEVVEPFGPWLPTVDRVVTLAAPAGVDVRVDPVGGGLMVPGRGARGLHYGAVSDVATPDPAAVAVADVGQDASARAATADHDVLPAELTDLRQRITGRAASPFQQVALLQLFLGNNPKVNDGQHRFAVEPNAPTGFTAGHISRFLTDDDKGRVGRAELFAAAFATLARSQGLPTRLVIGFAPTALRPGTTVELRDRDLTVWPEVAFAGVGWVPFDAVPDETTDKAAGLREEDIDSQVAAAGEQAITQAPDQAAAQNPNLVDQPPAPPAEGPTRLVRMAALVAGAVTVVAVVLMLSPWIRKRRRRGRRRTDPDPAARVEGAWCEVLDRLAEAGEEHVTALTTRRAAAATAVHVGDDAARAVTDLGRRRDAALHAPGAPSAEQAAEAWQISDAVRRLARQRRTRRQRVRAAIDRRPLTATVVAPPSAGPATGPPAGGQPSGAPASTVRDRAPLPGADTRTLVASAPEPSRWTS